ncbi:MAG TPA: glycosyltransferase [Polyangia bacterium]|nr:glycosyltransferase [Polyangia bacterium]
MRSLIVTLDPAMGGGVGTMQRVMRRAHRRLGLDATLAFARSNRRGRLDPRVRAGELDGHPTLSAGYWPSLEYLNYLLPAAALRGRLRAFPVLQVVSGMHSASLVPIVAGAPFVSWVATPFLDEIASRRAGAQPTASVRLNHGLRAINQRLERWSLRFPRVVLALSAYTARRLQELTGVDGARVEILRCPVDHQLFRPDGPRWAASPGRYVVSVGRVDDDRKNFAALVRAFVPAAARFPELHLVIVGPADRADNAVAALARSTGLGARIHFPGPLAGEELAAAYRGADAYVMTSRQEGLGIVVIEAQAAARPVVIMRCGGSDELVTDGADGRLVDQGDEEGFARALGEALALPDWLASAGAAGRAKVLRELTHEVFADRLRDIYGRVFPATADELAA